MCLKILVAHDSLSAGLGMHDSRKPPSRPFSGMRNDRSEKFGRLKTAVETLRPAVDKLTEAARAALHSSKLSYGLPPD